MADPLRLVQQLHQRFRRHRVRRPPAVRRPGGLCVLTVACADETVLVVVGVLTAAGAVFTRAVWPRRSFTAVGWGLGCSPVWAGSFVGASDLSLAVHGAGALLQVPGAVGRLLLGMAAWSAHRPIAAFSLVCGVVGSVASPRFFLAHARRNLRGSVRSVPGAATTTYMRGSSSHTGPQQWSTFRKHACRNGRGRGGQHPPAPLSGLQREPWPDNPRRSGLRRLRKQQRGDPAAPSVCETPSRRKFVPLVVANPQVGRIEGSSSGACAAE